MPQIKVQHFGPITNSGLIDIRKNTFFIGNQGSGKSTMAKLISLMMWMEKAYNRGDFKAKDLAGIENIKPLFKYHSINNYFKANSRLDYYGDKFNIIIYPAGGLYNISENHRNTLSVPKIMYVPAERNFLSTLKGANKVERLPENLLEFGEEVTISNRALNGEVIKLNLGNYKYSYDKNEGKSFVIGDDYKIDLTEASSGLQSYTPLYIVGDRLSKFIKNNTEEEQLKLFSVDRSIRLKEEINNYILSILDSDDKNILKQDIDKIRSKYFSKCFINIVEEPEQNLFPDSQWEVLKSLITFNNSTCENKLIVTTHSPYIINYLSILAQGKILFDQIEKSVKKSELLQKLNKIAPISALANPKDIAIYQLDKSNGSVSKLETYEGIPSDNNYLNENLRDGNIMFDSLLEIEEEL